MFATSHIAFLIQDPLTCDLSKIRSQYFVRACKTRYGELEPFGREDTAQELTDQSIQESDEMVDQLERAEVRGCFHS